MVLHIRTSVRFAIGLMMFAPLPGLTQDSGIRETFRFSCIHDAEFLSVAVSTPERGDFPAVRLILKDPNGRRSGLDVGKEQIPRSRYAKIFEIPRISDRSRATAIEICKPAKGKYSLTVEEETDSEYRLTIRGESKAAMESEPLHLMGRSGRKRSFEFNYFGNERKPVIEILSVTHKPLAPPELALMDEW